MLWINSLRRDVIQHLFSALPLYLKRILSETKWSMAMLAAGCWLLAAGCWHSKYLNIIKKIQAI
jgi:hypothetical protein